MPDERNSVDARREQLRLSHQSLWQDRARAAKLLRLTNATETAVVEFYRAVAAAGSMREDASFRGLPFDPAPCVRPIADKLHEALDALRQAGRFGVLDDVDLDEAFDRLCGSPGLDNYPKAHNHAAFHHALGLLRDVIPQGQTDLRPLVEELYFGADSPPAGEWFSCLLGIVQGRLRAEPKQPVAEPGPVATAEAPNAGETSKRRRGRKADTDPNKDRRVADAWRSGRYRTHEECGRELGIPTRQVKLAIDRDRKRRPSKPRRQQSPE